MVKHTKYLGVQIDQHLLWDEHLSVITKKISRGLGMLKYSKNSSHYPPFKGFVRVLYSLSSGIVYMSGVTVVLWLFKNCRSCKTEQPG